MFLFDEALNTVVNIFQRHVLKNSNIIMTPIKNLNTEGCSEPRRRSKMKLFTKIVNSFQPLPIFALGFILVVRLGSEYASEISK